MAHRRVRPMKVRRDGRLVVRIDGLAQTGRLVRKVTVGVDTGNVLVSVALAAAVVAQNQPGTDRAIVLKSDTREELVGNGIK